MVAAVSAYLVLGAVPSASPVIVNTNGTLLGSRRRANASIARVTDNLFTSVNFSSENASFEENSTFKWLKRTLYQPQNRVTSGVGL